MAKLVYKTKPYPHQVRALKKLLRQGGGGLQVPMRWGKSWVGINFSAALFLQGRVRRVLVITVTSGLGVWEDEIAKHCPVAAAWRVISHEGEILAQSHRVLKDEPTTAIGNPILEFMLVNYQNVYSRMYLQGREWVPMPNATLKKFNADVVIVDESHHIGNPTAEQSKYTRHLGRAAKHRVIMTGTMFHRKPFYVFGQALFYDDGASLGNQYRHYKRRVAIMGGFGGYTVKAYRNLDWMMKQLKWVHIEERVPTRPPVFNELHFHLTGDNLAAYSEMAKEAVLDVGKETVTSTIILSRHLRLQQIAGGFVRLPSGKYVQVGTSKLEIATDRLQEYREQGIDKAVVGCRFLPELAALAKAGKKIGFKVVLFHGGVPRGRERQRRIKFFEQCDQPVLFISQVATGSQAINLSAADTMMLYSLPESYLIYDQFTRRIELYDEKRTLQYDVLLARGSRDEVTWAALQLQRDVATMLIKDPVKAMQIATLEQS